MGSSDTLQTSIDLILKSCDCSDISEYNNKIDSGWISMEMYQGFNWTSLEDNLRNWLIQTSKGISIHRRGCLNVDFVGY